MSPAAAVGSARSRLNPAAWSLSSKLVATVVGLFLAVTLASGALTVLLLHQSLVRQLDEGVTASLVRAGGPDRGRPGGDGTGPSGPPGAGGESLFLRLSNGVATQSRVEHDRTSGTLTVAQIDALNAASIGSTPKTVDVPGLGDYRVVGRAAGGR